MSRHNASNVDLEATEHFEDGLLREGDEVTDEHSQGHYDEIDPYGDLYGSLAPAPERTTSWTGETPEPEAKPLGAFSLAAGVVGIAIGGALALTAAAVALSAVLWTHKPPTEPVAEAAVVVDHTARAPEEVAPATAPATAEPGAAPQRAEAEIYQPRAVPLAFDHDTWSAPTGPAFDRFAQTLRVDLDAAERPLVLTGHTDSTGTEEANLTMGLGRAWAVEVALLAKGFDDEAIELKSAGESEPIADNRTAAGRAKNRRVVAQIAE